MSNDKPLRLIFLGRRVNNKDKESIALLLLSDAGEVFGGERWFTPKKVPRFVPGSVVETTGAVSEDGNELQIVVQKMTFVEMWHDEQQNLEWASLDAQAKIRLKRMKMGRDADNALHDALRPIREEFRKTRGSDRAALLAEIIFYLHN